MNTNAPDTAVCPVCDAVNNAGSVYTHYKCCVECRHVIHLRASKAPAMKIITHLDLDFSILIPGKTINHKREFTVLGRYKLVLKSAYFNFCYAESSDGNQLWLVERNGRLWIFNETEAIQIEAEAGSDVADNIKLKRNNYNVVFKESPEFILLDGEAPNLPFMTGSFQFWFLRPKNRNQIMIFQNADQSNRMFELIPFSHE